MKAFRRALLIAGLLFSLSAFAQGPGRRGPMMDPEQQLKHLTTELKLSADQQEKIKPILQSQVDEMKKLREDTSLSREERMPKMRGIHEETNKKINAVLTEEQQKKYEEMQQQFRRGPGPGGPPPQN
jgi:Spy/CpxP family protein refolding chaperone